MKPGKRSGLSAAQKSEMWCRWKAGQTLHEIGRALGKEHSSIRCLVSRHGGFVPAVRQRSLLALTLREREEISRGLASGSSIREIAPIHSSVRSAEERADGALAIQAPHTPVAALSYLQRLARSNRRCYLHPRKARGS